MFARICGAFCIHCMFTRASSYFTFARIAFILFRFRANANRARMTCCIVVARAAENLEQGWNYLRISDRMSFRVRALICAESDIITIINDDDLSTRQCRNWRKLFTFCFIIFIYHFHNKKNMHWNKIKISTEKSFVFHLIRRILW